MTRTLSANCRVGRESDAYKKTRLLNIAPFLVNLHTDKDKGGSDEDYTHDTIADIFSKHLTFLSSFETSSSTSISSSLLLNTKTAVQFLTEQCPSFGVFLSDCVLADYHPHHYLSYPTTSVETTPFSELKTILTTLHLSSSFPLPTTRACPSLNATSLSAAMILLSNLTPDVTSSQDLVSSQASDKHASVMRYLIPVVLCACTMPDLRMVYLF
jgi:hypothetical protein